MREDLFRKKWRYLHDARGSFYNCLAGREGVRLEISLLSDHIWSNFHRSWRPLLWIPKLRGDGGDSFLGDVLANLIFMILETGWNILSIAAQRGVQEMKMGPEIIFFFNRFRSRLFDVSWITGCGCIPSGEKWGINYQSAEEGRRVPNWTLMTNCQLKAV